MKKWLYSLARLVCIFIGRIQIYSLYVLDLKVQFDAKTNLKTFSSSEAVWNYKKCVWTTKKLNGGRENQISMFLQFYLLKPDRQTDGQNIYRICLNMRGMCRENPSCLF